MEHSVLTNRELTALVILLVLVGFVLTRPGREELLKSIRGVLRSLAEPSIFVPLLLYVCWISLSVAGASKLGLWELGLLKTTILWLLISGLALVMGLNDAIRESGFFRRALIRALGLFAVVEFIAALKSFPLWLEIPSQALAVMFAMVAVVAERDTNHAPVRKLANAYLALFGISAVIWSIAHLIRTWSTLDQGAIIREFLLPIWLTPLALLFVYGFAVVAAYQSTFLQMRIWNKQGPLLRQMIAMMLRANGRLRYLRLLSGNGAQRIAKTDGFLQAWREVGVFRRKARESEIEKAVARQRSLISSGGVSPDTSGPGHENRGFEGTIASAVAAPLNASLRLTIEQEGLLQGASEELNRSKGEVEALQKRLQGSHEGFQWLGPIDTAKLIHLLAKRARTMEEIEIMALPVVMLLAISQLESLDELVDKFDRLLRLAGEPANRAMSVADTLTAATQASTATFSEMLDAMIAAYSPDPSD